MAEPGMLYWDKIQNWNLFSEDDSIEYAGVNPCAEEPLPAYGSCLLGSVNLSEFVNNPFTNEAKFNLEEFKQTVSIAVRALNEVLHEGLPLHPLKQQQECVNELRQIGLGCFGWHDALIKMGIKYGNQKSLDLANEIGEVLINAAAIRKVDGCLWVYPAIQIAGPQVNLTTLLKEPMLTRKG